MNLAALLLFCFCCPDSYRDSLVRLLLRSVLWHFTTSGYILYGTVIKDSAACTQGWKYQHEKKKIFL
jgi:hypothetical protein